jgi:hypothetical protein
LIALTWCMHIGTVSIYLGFSNHRQIRKDIYDAIMNQCLHYS